MKKLTMIVICCVLLLSLCSCKFIRDYSVRGVENFDAEYSDFELNVCLLPTEDFLERYEYINADYRYSAENAGVLSLDESHESIVMIQYEDDVYLQAKQYCLDNMELSDSNIIPYGDYIFFENIELAVGMGKYGSPIGFPRWFNMFAYNDTLRQLVFIGYYDSTFYDVDIVEFQKQWGSFLQEHFGEVYILSKYMMNP